MELKYTPKMLVCTCCGKSKPIGDFDKQSYTGLPTKQCTDCIRIKKKVTRDKRRHSKFVSKEKRRGMEEIDYDIKHWRDVMVFFGGRCAYCGQPDYKASKLERDHLVPLSKGGKTTRINIVPSCSHCNRSRGNKEWRSWFRERDHYTYEREMRLDAWINQ